jgi:dihydroorotate dehydrogenase electron transfer subunit
LFFLDYFAGLGVQLHLATEDGSLGEHGRVTVLLDRHLRERAGNTNNLMVYACGPEPMLAAVSKLAATHGHPSQVSVERVMGCGLGGCYSCVIPIKTAAGSPRYVRSCIAGPTFRGEDIAWQ